MYHSWNLRKLLRYIAFDMALVLAAILLTRAGRQHFAAVDSAGGVSLPVLMYHSIAPVPETQYCISPETLESDLQYLQEHHYTAVSPEELIAYTEGTGDLPEKPVLLTFDDGLYNNLSLALPLLEKYDMCAVISVVGSFDEKEALDKLESYFGGIKRHTEADLGQKRLNVVRDTEIIKKDTEQCHICMGLEGVSRDDDRIYDLLIINALFGGNMSSRLFQRVREDAGLAYSIYSFANTYKNNGSWVLYAGLNTESLFDAMKIINEETVRLKRDKLTREEIDVAKEQMKASVIMGIESMSGRMSSYGRSVLFDNKIRTPEEIIAQIESVNTDSVAETIERVFDIDKLNIAVTGRIENTEEEIAGIMNF